MTASTSPALSRRSFLRLSALGVGAAALAACAPVAAPGGSDAEAGAMEPTSVSFLTQGGGENAFLRYEPLIESFQAANPDITIAPIWEPGGAIEIQTKLLTLIAAGDAPDAYWAHSYTNSGQAVRNIQLDLNPFIDADDDISGDDFCWQRTRTFSNAGRQIGFPRETTSTVIIYNAELFDSAGMNRPAEGWTGLISLSALRRLLLVKAPTEFLELPTGSSIATHGSRCGRKAATC